MPRRCARWSSPATSSTWSSGCATPSASSPAVRIVASGTVRELRAAEGGRQLRVVVARCARRLGRRAPRRPGGQRAARGHPAGAGAGHRRPGRAGRRPAHRAGHPLRLAGTHAGRAVPRGRARRRRWRRDRARGLGAATGSGWSPAGRSATRVRDKGFLISSAVIVLLVLGVMGFQLVVGGSGSSTTDRHRRRRRPGRAGPGPRRASRSAPRSPSPSSPTWPPRGRRSSDGDVDAVLVGGAGDDPQVVVGPAGTTPRPPSPGPRSGRCRSPASSVSRAWTLVPPPAITYDVLDPAAESDSQAVVVALLGVVVLYALLHPVRPVRRPGRGGGEVLPGGGAAAGDHEAVAAAGRQDPRARACWGWSRSC